jgi:hypothetical protein
MPQAPRDHQDIRHCKTKTIQDRKHFQYRRHGVVPRGRSRGCPLSRQGGGASPKELLPGRERRQPRNTEQFLPVAQRRSCVTSLTRHWSRPRQWQLCAPSTSHVARRLTASVRPPQTPYTHRQAKTGNQDNNPKTPRRRESSQDRPRPQPQDPMTKTAKPRHDRPGQTGQDKPRRHASSAAAARRGGAAGRGPEGT